MSPRTWVEIQEQALLSNIETLRGLIGSDVTLAPVVKANAYGHGQKEVVGILTRAGVRAFCVDHIDDALAIRRLAPDALILQMGHTPEDAFAEAVSKKIHLALFETSSLLELERVAQQCAEPALVHLKVDTGMSRLGFLPADISDALAQIQRLQHVKVAGVMSHFADADDTAHPDFCSLQFKRFDETVQAIKAAGFDPSYIHCANSAASILYPPTHGTLVRPGLILYGLWPSEGVEDVVRKHSIPCELNPVLSWKTRLIQIKTIPPGTSVGYGRTEMVSRRSRIGVIPVGYADGYDRGLSKVGHVLIQGTRCKILGTVCMNLTVVDISQVPQVTVGTEVTLLGKGGPHLLGARELARWLSTNEYEIVSSINPLIPRQIR